MLMLYNQHPAACGTPPALSNESGDLYIGYFANRSGEPARRAGRSAVVEVPYYPTIDMKWASERLSDRITILHRRWPVGVDPLASREPVIDAQGRVLLRISNPGPRR
jgi:hypothetical protein